MKVLVIGDEHTYGYGLPTGKVSYLGHFIRLINRAGQEVSVEAYAHLTMSQTARTLAQLPLNRYDLIILQMSQSLLQPADYSFLDEQRAAGPVLPYPFVQANSVVQQHSQSKRGTLTRALLSLFWPPYGLKGIASLFKQLRPYRHNVLIVTPLPCRAGVSQWLQKRSRTVLLHEADKQLFSVFDSDSVIQPGEEYFLPNDPSHLNAVSHELLGHMLFDFYQSAPTIVTIQSIRRQHD